MTIEEHAGDLQEIVCTVREDVKEILQFPAAARDQGDTDVQDSQGDDSCAAWTQKEYQGMGSAVKPCQALGLC